MAERDPYYIHAEAAPATLRTRVLKSGETFAVFDPRGDVRAEGLGEQGIFHLGTRHLSHYVLRLGPRRPFLLSSSVLDDNTLLAVDFTNPDLELSGAPLPRGSVHLLRSKFLQDSSCFERLRLTNFSDQEVEIELVVEFEVDFADIFEVRGMRRPKRGETLEPQLGPDFVKLSYRGLDGAVRASRLTFRPAPEHLGPAEARLRFKLAPREERVQFIQLSCGGEPSSLVYDEALAALTRERAAECTGFCAIDTSNSQFNEWVGRSVEDLRMMTTRTPAGPFPYAGVPWYSAPFGRDALITALQTLWVNPSLAAGVLRYLALTQARAEVPEKDAEPGKILHESRKGEMAALGEVPFDRYYGSVDSTPLFLLLAGEYFAHTGDRRLIEGLWPALEAALDWLARAVDVGNGFVTYRRRSAPGREQPGGKDSGDSVFHEDGQLASGPVALCEVQGYAFAAWTGIAAAARTLSREDLARSCEARASSLRERFEKAFWLEELSTYALALDGEGRPCRVRTSNAGQVLLSGLPSPERAERVSAALQDEASFSGWGVRTVASGEKRYNPMAYHNGSVWPHDNALIAAGAARYGHKGLALSVFQALFDASRF
ncbi:MAG: amylo-alpha-1,6-glucosidase, partial [Myxococcaceae bacterium]